MHKAQTRQWIRRSQVGAAVLLLAAGALAMAPISWSSAPAVLKPRAAVASGKSAASGAARTDMSSLAGSLGSVVMPMPLEKPPTPPAPVTPAPPETPEEPKVTLWEYIGGIIGPSLRKAIVTVEGEQKMVAEGQEIGAVTVHAITADFIMIEEKGEERRIDRKARKERMASAGGISNGSSLVGVNGANGMNGKGGANAAAMSGLDPAAAAAAAARNRALGAQIIGRKPTKAEKGDTKEVKGGEPAEPMNEKTRRIYADAMRANGGVPPSPELLQKMGLPRMDPNEDDINEIRRLLFEEGNR